MSRRSQSSAREIIVKLGYLNLGVCLLTGKRNPGNLLLQVPGAILQLDTH